MLIPIEVRQRNSMDVAQHMVIHAMVEEQGSKLVGLSSDVDVVGREVEPRWQTDFPRLNFLNQL